MLDAQYELVKEYIKIEKFPEPVWDMRLKINQLRFKGFLFRIIEELSEAQESLLENDITNFWTEIADSMAFALEIGIVSGILPGRDLWALAFIPRIAPANYDYSTVREWFWESTYQLGMVSNVLRSKEWKQTEVLPDMEKFKELMQDFYRTYFNGFSKIGCSEAHIVEWYLKKNAVNVFRQRSKY
ncbi:MAG: hypothetical protein DRI65_15350 [Chloroflexota bacterium]|nr:MAG: hypothetical protein DRI65_15350 [Chloroflexota bacterium]